MANPTGTFATYQAIGRKEDLSDIIYNISPTDTPFQSMIGRSKATSTKHEHQTDAFATSSATGQVVEGNTPTNTTVTPTVRVFNYCEILQDAFQISGTQNAVRNAGRAEEIAYQLMKTSASLKRNQEAALSGANGAVSGATGTARVSASLESWISTNWTTQGASPTSSASEGFSSSNLCTAPVDATTAATVTEANVKAMIRAAWTQGGKPDVLLCGPYNKVKISGFSGILTNNIFQQAGGQAKIVAAADGYVSDFGTFKVVPSRFSRDRTISIIDTDFWSVAYLRNWQQSPLAKVGDSEQRMVLVEYTLESRNQKASAKVADLATTG
jgi:hypothetical protein